MGSRGLGALAAVAAIALTASPALASHNSDIHTPNLSVVHHDEFAFGTDLDFEGRTVVAGAGDWDGTHPTGIRLYDSKKPAQPKGLAFANCDAWHSDVGLWGKLAFQSVDDGDGNDTCSPGAGQEGVRIYDISNRRKPQSIGFAETIHGSHNFSVVDDAGLIYVSSYNLTDPTDVDGVSIVDVKADPQNPPVTFLEFPDVDATAEHEDMANESGDPLPDSPGCHDIGIDLERDLAYCAAITETMIWDISDRRRPVIVSIIRNPAINIHHGAYPNADGDVLVVNDEWAGASGGPTGCLLPQAPTGALWFYDVSDPRNPQGPLSYFAPPDPAPTDDFCTSHFFGTFPDRDWLVTSWYDHGIYVVDFSNPAAPQLKGRYDPGGAGEGANFWSAYPHQGYLYANSFAPATLTSSDPANRYGGLWVFALEGYTPD